MLNAEETNDLGRLLDTFHDEFDNYYESVEFDDDEPCC
jgi:hypothetical protein